ncbi:unnamed protein product [Spodoptera littoralis]|uniref:Uncharacterized protein n=1 Tax=Spodoptera littoralis TaxID=7109 RepID=A0A9P0IM35_SPOLI|nr:unnamed protein product [Spodoptera littoralis]CAH1647483.1 unnamed protein product [Spodoptera littoralis]
MFHKIMPFIPEGVGRGVH